MNHNKYVDAQGNQMPVNGTRLAKVKFGKITFKENFILSPICLGHLLRDGWGISNADGQQWLVKGDLGIPVELRGNSLVGKGRICVVQARVKNEECVEEVEKKECGRVNALVLLPALQNLVRAMRSTTMEYQDTTVVPADTMLWCRSTLLKVDGRWQLEEDSQDVTLLDRLDGVLCLEATEVLTLANNFRPRRGGQLGFYEDGADEMLEDFVAGVPVEVPGVRAGLSQEVQVADEHGVPAAQGEARP